ncbi:MAG: nitroreductase family protein [Deltaproteobacteria bacterium]|jgi:nitroreductase|nr:nitroreductase family protein [Deltaproteobacteria bacterium]
MTNKRTSPYQIDEMFLDRWSPRSFSSKPVSKEIARTIFEAARWAPSCYNEQPWHFLYALEGEKHELFLSLLVKQNQIWAQKAPLLSFLLAKNKFSFNNKENKWAQFDCGAAWLSAALQARKLGLHAHAMAGFKSEKAYEELNVDPEEYTIVCAIAFGYKGDPDELPPALQEQEIPSSRKELSKLIQNGRFE